MVIRTKLRSQIYNTAYYIICGGLTLWFLWSGYTGDRGTAAKKELMQKEAKLSKELDNLRNERFAWERRVTLLSSEAIDKDILEERAKASLSYVHKNDVVIILP